MRGLLRLLCITLPVAALAQSRPPIHALGPTVATAPAPFAAVSQVVAIGAGRVLVSDAVRRAVTLFDSSLGAPRVVLDSTTGRQNTFASGIGAATGAGRGGGGSAGANFLMPFRGDSALWFDRSASTFVVLDADGRQIRTMASPPSAGAGLAFTTSFGLPLSSATLGLVYKVQPPIGRPASAAVPTTDSVTRVEDSLVIVRMDYATRAVDTVGRIVNGYSLSTRTLHADGSVTITGGSPLFPFFDNVAVTTDGSIAFFRAREYRMDWITPDGRRAAGPRLPYDWQPITDALRQHILDSINGGRRRVYDSLLAKRAADSARTGSVPKVKAIRITPDGDVPFEMPLPPPTLPTLVKPELVPDYYPPTLVGAAVLADADNHVWIRPSLSLPDPDFVVWDIVSRAGGVIERVRVPSIKTIAGFGPGGFVYLVTRDAGSSTLEKVRIR